jgi:hypothetical protein
MTRSIVEKSRFANMQAVELGGGANFELRLHGFRDGDAESMKLRRGRGVRPLNSAYQRGPCAGYAQI